MGSPIMVQQDLEQRLWNNFDSVFYNHISMKTAIEAVGAAGAVGAVGAVAAVTAAIG